jgi:methionyl aminopeptidase
MPIIIKTRREIELMRAAGRLGNQILQEMKSAVRPGASTERLNQIARDELHRHGAIGLSKNYPTYKPGEGYPAETCISVNEEVVHGVPGPRMLKEGDVVTLDLALSLEGYCADTAITVPVGKVLPAAQKLLDITRHRPSDAVQRRAQRAERHPRICRSRHRPNHA